VTDPDRALSYMGCSTSLLSPAEDAPALGPSLFDYLVRPSVTLQETPLWQSARPVPFEATS
jgi:hypothetical protein